MTASKRKKNTRQRGTQTHGWGSKKKHRGAGNRGGKGMAGTGKRGDAKKPCIWKERYFGKFGFKKKNIQVKIKAITIKTVDQMIEKWAKMKLAEEKGGVVAVDLEKIGYNKLLSNGKISKKIKISVPYASAKAVEKIKSAGGEIVGLTKSAAEEKKEE
ncbi:uL15 family ribosomal protein [Candidatus Woesearchaeota archaeon]|nr:uL15 family ribosomal protein [Candidatus Woesearchaeota archaeon]